MTILAQLEVEYRDYFGYITYVFKCLDGSLKESDYVMCTRFPNWNQKDIKLGDKGFLEFKSVVAGIDKWFDGEKMIPYRYNNIQFIKFIELPKKEDVEFIM